MAQQTTDREVAVDTETSPNVSKKVMLQKPSELITTTAVTDVHVKSMTTVSMSNMKQ
ncbi:hypothetical protein [Staphylococcus americanisciuri]|uniref:Uncharacterized protein n=1 Tax=Staphylococcus americanisciuri TaxID=2973940 RepID=A0ABT2EZX6_9STAP|nr:hypothetical protein [Staphylococcus americanisciuri]MCS4485755.1 hypothetical protein [Staphylococcus americanisciuri]